MKKLIMVFFIVSLFFTPILAQEDSCENWKAKKYFWTGIACIGVTAWSINAYNRAGDKTGYVQATGITFGIFGLYNIGKAAAIFNPDGK